ncbi:MAG: FapA family protein [Spirochaetales bacterium]|nr:FapA family protein [Spirochaetales bacterium]
MNQESLVNIFISEDGLQALMQVDFKKCGDNPPSLDALESALSAQGISFGVNFELLKKILEEKIDKEVCVAQGKKPQKSSPPYLKVKKNLYNSRPPIEEHGYIDYKMVSPFIMVKKGECLAKRIPASKGEEGRSVTNEVLPPAKKDIEQLEAGENTVEKDGMVYAVTSGRFELDRKEFHVNELLEIPGNVDYSTGHISFPGDVIIRGEIRDGFRVAAGGSIHCKETVDASEVFTRKDLIIEGGIIGRNKSIVRVQGKVETKFIEHCQVEALGGIAVKSSVIDSDIVTLGELVLLKNGKLIGGSVYAEKGLTTHTVGSPSNGNIKINLGISFVEARHLAGQQKILKDIQLKRDKIKAISNVEKRKELEAKVEAAVVGIRNGIAEQITKQFVDFGATLTVTGTLYPGAQITICDRNLIITEEQEKVVVFYDEEKQEIAIRGI